MQPSQSITDMIGCLVLSTTCAAVTPSPDVCVFGVDCLQQCRLTACSVGGPMLRLANACAVLIRQEAKTSSAMIQ